MNKQGRKFNKNYSKEKNRIEFDRICERTVLREKSSEEF
jgi:hypothetical protein